MQFKMLDINEIQKAPYNPRMELTPSDPAFLKIKASLKEYGCVEPIVVNEVNNRCVGGHQRLAVMRYLKYKEVPCVFINEPDETREKALNIALNKIDNKFDEAKLTAILEELNDNDFDLALTGFNETEIDDLLAEVDIEGFGEESGEEEEQEYEESDVMCKVGIYTFFVEREMFLAAVNEIRRVVGFNDNEITEEFKRRIKA